MPPATAAASMPTLIASAIRIRRRLPARRERDGRLHAVGVRVGVRHRPRG